MHHAHQHHPVLVVFSIVIAVLASYTAMELAISMAFGQQRSRLAWIAAGAVAMGAGIWSMHFVAMLAFTLPGIRIAYDVSLLLLSVFVAIAGSAVALFAASQSVLTRAVQVICSVAMGAAIAGLHYIGIAAMRMPVHYAWNYGLVAASIGIALIVSWWALSLAARFRADLSPRGFLIRALASVAMGLGIAGMHYTAMAAMIFLPGMAAAPTEKGLLATSGLAVAVIGAALLIVGIALIGCAVGRAMARRQAMTESALEAVRLRDEFLSIATHELHTPIHALLLVVQGVGSGIVPMTPEGMSRAFRLVERQARRLTRLTDTLLEMSQIQAGRLTFHIDEVDLVAVTNDLLEQLADEFAGAGCAVSVRTSSGSIVGHWDRRRVEKVVAILLSNAAKFGRGAPIDIAIERVDGAARLFVEDHGIGIPADCFTVIFERFGRAVSAEQYGGLGLGLYIVQALTRMMGGSVEVRSRVGVGSTFVLTLPEGAPAAA